MLWPGMMSGMYIFSMYPPKKRGVASIQEILGASRRGFTGRDLGGHRSQDFLQEMMGFYMCFRNVLIICLISDIRNGASSSSPKRNGVKALPWPGPSRWASGRSLDNSVCGTWKILEKIRFTSGFLKFGIMGFGIPHPVFSLKPQSHRDRTTMGSGLLNVSHEVCLRKIEIKSFVVIHLRKLFFCVFCVLMWAVPFFKSTCEAKTF